MADVQPRSGLASVPTLSVVMPVHNGERFLAQAIDSILRQSFSDFEFIVVDDGSTDSTSAILDSYRERDRRLLVHRQEPNRGNYPARNQGCRLARGEFIAVMDADDISLSQRFATQIEYLRQHPDVALVSGWVQLCDQHGQLGRVHQYPTESALVAWSMLFFNPISHPCMMFRRNAVDVSSVYREEYPVAADYALMFDLSQRARLTTLPEVLLHYRTWTGNLSKRPDHAYHSMRVVRDSVSRLGLRITDEQAYQLQGLSRDRYPKAAAEIREMAALVSRLHARYREHVARDAADRRLIDRDAGIRLWLLAALAVRQAPSLGASLALTATRIAPLSIVSFGAKVLQRLRK